MTELENQDILLDFLNIKHGQISPRFAVGCHDGIQSMNNVFVAYQDSLPLPQYGKKMFPCGLNCLHDNLTRQLLLEKGTDPTRMSGQVVEKEKTFNIRLTFGYGCIQPTVEDRSRWKVYPWQWNGKQMPTIQSLPFKKLPKE